MLLKDIISGTGLGISTEMPASLTTVGNLVYFQDGDGAGGIDLWKTDGTTAGTVLVKHIASATYNFGSSPAPATALQNLSAQNGLLMFSANDAGIHGAEPWRSDGTALGTIMLKDIDLVAPTASASRWEASAVAGSNTLFLGSDLAHGRELWASDGTVGAPGSSPTSIRARRVPARTT